MTDPHAGKDQPDFTELGDPHARSTNLIVELLDETDERGRNLWRLLKSYQHRIGPGVCVPIPEGYVTNLGTIPWVCYRIATPASMREPAVVHDWMCNESYQIGKYVYDSGWPRPMADALLKEGLRERGFGWFRRNAIYVCVRLWAITTKKQEPDK